MNISDTKGSRDYTQIDRLLIRFCRVLDARTEQRTNRPFPTTSTDPETLTARDRRLAGRYMRVNHVGEICAQALYHSQAITARDSKIHTHMEQAAAEEADHLAWCEQRIAELGARKSLLNPLWWLGSFTIGGLAGMAGDKWNLGFVAETERQVVKHLEEHLGKLPQNDVRSREVVAKMQQDENEHAESAMQAGAAELPLPIKRMMRFASKVMTSTAYWI